MYLYHVLVLLPSDVPEVDLHKFLYLLQLEMPSSGYHGYYTCPYEASLLIDLTCQILVQEASTEEVIVVKGGF